jgi:hypothetical protein
VKSMKRNLTLSLIMMTSLCSTSWTVEDTEMNTSGVVLAGVDINPQNIGDLPLSLLELLRIDEALKAGNEENAIRLQAHQNSDLATQILGDRKNALDEEARNAVEAFRAFCREHSDGSNSDQAIVEHQELFVPFADKLLTVMKDEYLVVPESNKVNLAKLIVEVMETLEEKRVSPNWLMDMHFRFLALEGITKTEKDLFSHVPHHEYLDALLSKDTRGNAVVVDLYKWATSLAKTDEYYYTSGHKESYFPNVSDEAWHLISKEIVKHLAVPFIVPSLGVDVFPIPHLLQNWLDEIYDIGIPLKEVKDVHGEPESSRLGFAYHDLFHFKNDKRRVSLLNYIGNIVNQYVEAGGFAEDVIPDVVRIAVRKFKLVMEALKLAYTHIKDDPKALVGFFMPAHEAGVFVSSYQANVFSEDLFQMPNPGLVIDALVNKSIEFYENEEAWENPGDPLKTHPVDGQSPLTAKEITKKAIKRLAEDSTLNLPQTIYHVYDEQGAYKYIAEEPAEINQLNISWLTENTRSTVTRGAQFIDVAFRLPNATQKIITFPTLLRKWKNMNASRQLLALAGINLDRPELNGQPFEVRTQAIDFLDLVLTNLTDTMKHFASQAKSSFGEGEKSYASDYEIRFKALDAELESITGIAPGAGVMPVSSDEDDVCSDSECEECIIINKNIPTKG